MPRTNALVATFGLLVAIGYGFAGCGFAPSGTGGAGASSGSGTPLGTGASNGTGLVGTWSGSRYVGSGQYRPWANSKMNSLFGNATDTSFNPVSREQAIFTIWRYVTPIDSTVPAAGAVSNPGLLTVNVVDPAVISVDWTVDGTTMTNAGTTFDTSTLAAGSHTISAKAYDNATSDWVRYKSGTCPSSVTGSYCSRTAWPRSTQTVSWTVTK